MGMTVSTSDNQSEAVWIPSARWRAAARSLIPLAALVLLLAISTVIERTSKGTSYFLTAGNLMQVMRAQAPVGIIAVGMTLVIVGGGIDLSVGSMVAMAAVCGVYVMNLIRGDVLAISAAVGVMVVIGVCAGFVNGSLVAWGRVAPFIATLGGLAAYRSVARTVFDGTVLFTHDRSLAPFHNGGIPIPFTHLQRGPAVFFWPSAVFIGVAAAGWIILNKTRFGRHLVAVGGNERAAAYSAIPVNRVKVASYVLAGLCCGIAAMLNAASVDSVSSGEVGVLNELDAIAAVVVGGTLIAGGSGTMFGTVIGVLILGTVDNMMVMLSVPNTWQGMVKGAIIVGAAVVQQFGKRK
jgi:ribose transport system permease protein